MSKLNIIFAGTPDFAADILAHLLDQDNHHISAVYTQPDREAGRGRKVSASSVKQLLIDRNINVPIEQPDNFKKRNPEYQGQIDRLKRYQPDLIVVVAYGLILPKEVLEIPKYGCINIHASLLPRWRGAAPIQRAILMGDSVTGVSIQQMDTGLDTGDIIAEKECRIEKYDTSITLSQKLLALTYPLLTQTLHDISINSITLKKQNDEFACYAHKIDKNESSVNFTNSADYIGRQIRAFTPWPGTQFSINDKGADITIKIIEAEVLLDSSSDYAPGSCVTANKDGIVIQCARGQLKITKLQFSGGKVLTAQEALNGKFKELFKNCNPN